VPVVQRLVNHDVSLLLDPHYHRLDTGKLLDVAFAKAHLAHPSTTIGSCIIGAALRLDQHGEAHQQTGNVLSPSVVDQMLIDDEGSATVQGSVCLSEQLQLLLSAPVVQDHAHHDYIGAGQRIFEKIARAEADAVAKPERSHVLLEERLHCR